MVTELDLMMLAFHRDPSRGPMLADWWEENGHDWDDAEEHGHMKMSEWLRNPRGGYTDRSQACLLSDLADACIDLPRYPAEFVGFWYWGINRAISLACQDIQFRAKCPRLLGANEREWLRVEGTLAGVRPRSLLRTCPNEDHYRLTRYLRPVTLRPEVVRHEWVSDCGCLKGRAEVTRWVGRCGVCRRTVVDEKPTVKNVSLEFEVLEPNKVTRHL